MIAPLPFAWDGEALRPTRPRLADLAYVIGETYLMAPVEERSDASHKHEFAWLREAWRNLPENLADEFPTPEHLRKRALIDAGFYEEQIIDAGSNAAALRVASGIRGRKGEEFTLVIVRGPLVVIRSPESQSQRAMGKERFQASKTAILETVSAMIGVEPTTLARAA